MDPRAENPLGQPSAPPITPLPAKDIAQIKSSVAITGLVDVVIGLVKNSLDARARKIDISLNFGRGNCTVEDNGIGIAAHEFGQDGGLVRPYWTSKSKSTKVYGRHGTFLAAVAAVSLLTICSRQMSHRSLNAVVFHHSKQSARYTPASSQNELSLGDFGTKVSVRNLFGNMPVRVKQRSLLDETNEASRCWKNIKAEIVALLIAWSTPVALVLHDEKTGLKLTVRAKNVPGRTQINPWKRVRRSDFDLDYILDILTQSSFILPDSWASWVPVSGSTALVSIKGAISLDPAPSKQCQFVSLDIQPLPSGQSHNELYNEINRLFSNSKFGVIDEDLAVTNIENERRKIDGRFKPEGFAEKNGQKGIDRWPMFYLRISLKENSRRAIDVEDHLFDDHAEFRTILDLLCAVATQWLTEHHFMPKKSKKKREYGQKGMNELSMALSMPNRLVKRVAHLDRGRALQQPISFASDNDKAEGSSLLLSLDESDTWNNRFAAANTWSRVKAGSDRFYVGTFAVGSGRGSELVPSESISPSEPTKLHRRPANNAERHASNDWLRSLLDKWKNPVFHNSEAPIQRASIQNPHHTIDVNGCCRDRTENLGSRSALVLADNFVSNKISVAGLKMAEVVSQLDGKFILVKVPLCNVTGLNRELENFKATTMLAVIDQHAADERCKVERLLEELCEHTDCTSDKTLVSNLGHTALIKTTVLQKPISFQVPINEFALFERHAGYFARWGILYDLLKPNSSTCPNKIETSTGKIRTLPPGISERCVGDPTLAIELLRAEIWSRDEGPKYNIFQTKTSDNLHSWVQSLASCPQKLIEMINSRACRSSIMFNDPLEPHECQDLVARLSECAFPFQCAHGRPSLVPLADIGEITSDSQARARGTGIFKGEESVAAEGHVTDPGFAQAYRRWRRS